MIIQDLAVDTLGHHPLLPRCIVETQHDQVTLNFVWLTTFKVLETTLKPESSIFKVTLHRLRHQQILCQISDRFAKLFTL
jgi:hypothetical protein